MKPFSLHTDDRAWFRCHLPINACDINWHSCHLSNSAWDRDSPKSHLPTSARDRVLPRCYLPTSAQDRATPCLWLAGGLRMAVGPYFLLNWKRGSKFYIFENYYEKWGSKFYIFAQNYEKWSKIAKLSQFPNKGSLNSTIWKKRGAKFYSKLKNGGLNRRVYLLTSYMTPSPAICQCPWRRLTNRCH